MPSIKALVNTVLKARPSDSTTLKPEELEIIKKGTVVDVTWIKEEFNHYKVELKQPIKGRYNWYVFKPHLTSDSEKHLLNPTISLAQRVVNYMEAKGYKLFKGKEECNLVGLEGINPDGHLNKDEIDRWNDLIGIIKFNAAGVPFFDCIYKGTTEPGRFYTVNPLNPNGAARLVPGQYTAWRLGLHKGKPGLVQCRPLKIQRDKNKDGSRAGDIVTTEDGIGINIHRGPVSNNSSIGRHSAGCSVIALESDFIAFYNIAKSDPRAKANKSFIFTYTLVVAKELYAE